MNFYYPISNDKVNVVSLKVANIDEMYWSYSEDIEKREICFSHFSIVLNGHTKIQRFLKSGRSIKKKSTIIAQEGQEQILLKMH